MALINSRRKRTMNNIQNTQIETRNLQKYQDETIPVQVYLTSGIKLEGLIQSFDDVAITLERGLKAQTVYKHAIAAIQPDE